MRRAIGAAAGVAALTGVAVGAGFQAYAARRDRLRFPAPGLLVNVDGRRVHLDVRGPDVGPTVVLEAGMGSFSPNWHWVQDDLARSVRVVAYDRAGLGWSDRSPGPRDARTLAEELRAALRAAAVPGPFVLAGHSFGWLPVRAFAALYPQETVGLVAVDGSSPDQWARWPTRHADRMLATSQRVTAGLARLGLLRVLDVSAGIAAGLPVTQAARLRALSALPQTSSVEAAQMDAWPCSRAQLNDAPPLGDLPLAVLGVSEQPFGAATLTALQEDMAAQGTNTVRRIVAGATHEGLVSRREFAAVVAGAVRAVLATGPGERLANTWG